LFERNVYHCDPTAKATAYLSLVRPLLEYAAAAWDPYRLRDIERHTPMSLHYLVNK